MLATFFNIQLFAGTFRTGGAILKDRIQDGVAELEIEGATEEFPTAQVKNLSLAILIKRKRVAHLG
jgi:hypothetical protein